MCVFDLTERQTQQVNYLPESRRWPSRAPCNIIACLSALPIKAWVSNPAVWMYFPHDVSSEGVPLLVWSCPVADHSRPVRFGCPCTSLLFLIQCKLCLFALYKVQPITVRVHMHRVTMLNHTIANTVSAFCNSDPQKAIMIQTHVEWSTCVATWSDRLYTV